MKRIVLSQIGYISLVVTALIYGVFPIFTRMVGDNLPLYYQAWSRALVTAILMAIISFAANRRIPVVSVRDAKWLVVRAVFGVFGFVGVFLALTNMTVSESYMIYFALYLVFGVVAGRVLFGEVLDRTRVISLIVAAAGLWVVYGAQIVSFDPYLVWAAVAGAGYSGWSILPKKLVGTYTELELNYIDMFLFTGLVFVLSVVAREPWVLPEANIVWAASAALGVIWMVTGYLIVYGFARVDAALGSVAMLTEIPFALIGAYLVFGEKLAANQVIGGVMIVFAMAYPELVQFVQKKNSR